MKPRVLVFFLDGGTWTLLRPGIDRGMLPTMARIIREGSSGILESVVPMETSYATAAFSLGKHPAALGAFRTDVRGDHPVTSDRFSGKRLWETLGEAGLRSVVIDFPCTWPPSPFPGIMFTGFFTPEGAEDFVFPQDLAKRYPDYPRGGIEIMKWLRADRKTLLEKEYEVTRGRFSVFRDLCAREKFDFGCFYVKATDLLQHYLWDDQEELLRFWAFLDGLLAESMRDGWTRVLIASDHGFDEAPRTAFFTNRWLADEGFLHPKAITGGKAGGLVRIFFGRHRNIARLFYRTRNAFAGSQTERAVREADHLAEQYPGKSLLSGQVDLPRSDAYAPGGALHGKGIYINQERYLIGSAQRAACRDRIMERLRAVRFGCGPAFRRVARGEEVYPGEDPREIPDVVVVPVPTLFVEDRLGERTIGPRETRSRALGHHLASPDGIVLCAGEGIIPGDLGRVSILDLYPTILAWYGIPAPADVSGRAIPSLVERLPPRGDREILDAIASISF